MRETNCEIVGLFSGPTHFYATCSKVLEAMINWVGPGNNASDVLCLHQIDLYLRGRVCMGGTRHGGESAWVELGMADKEHINFPSC